MAKPSEPKNNNKAVFLIISFVIFTLLTLAIYFSLRVYGLNKKGKLANALTGSRLENTTDSEWKEYKNSLLGFRMSYPPSLVERDLGQSATYYNFIRFEEVKLTSDKGIAVGVRESSLVDEVNRIKKDFESQEDAVLSEQKKVKVAGTDGTWLHYKPKVEEGNEEERVIVIFARDKFSYSISTVPEQINRVINNFTFPK